jgi:SAM-dependent methyltransferase
MATMDAMDTLQIVLVVILSFLLANYLYLRWSMTKERIATVDNIEAEGFANPDAADGEATGALGNDSLYDSFYAKIYDQIVDGSVRNQQEVGLTLSWAKSYRPDVAMLKVLDVGCGTGGDVDEFKKEGVKYVVGLDASDAMIAVARKTYPKNDYRVGNVDTLSLFNPGEFNLITMFYFTFYYIHDRTQAFHNMYQWLQPGGCLVVHLVNREKFDPILESANPFVAFSPQKYTKERITRSKVAFDKFKYEAEFSHQGDEAEFREEFKFKDGKKRRHVHRLKMISMEAVVQAAESAGFTFKQYIDMTPIGYEYQYLFCFVR